MEPGSALPGTAYAAISGGSVCTGCGLDIERGELAMRIQAKMFGIVLCALAAAACGDNGGGTGGAAGTGGTGGTGGDLYRSGDPSNWSFNAANVSNIAPSTGGGTFFAGGTKSGTASTSDENGIDGVGYGSGGSGARSSSNATDFAGGDGADGVIIVHEYTQ